MSFDDRLAVGGHLEERVLRALRRRLWLAEPFGQGQLSEEMRDRLKRLQTPVRWMADIIAAKDAGGLTVVAFIDAKGGETYRRTGNYCVEAAALSSAEGWIQHSVCCGYYFVFADLGVLTPEEVRAWATPGRWKGHGSGSPFLLVPADLARPFDSVFGTVAE